MHTVGNEISQLEDSHTVRNGISQLEDLLTVRNGISQLEDSHTVRNGISMLNVNDIEQKETDLFYQIYHLFKPKLKILPFLLLQTNESKQNPKTLTTSLLIR